MKQFGLHQQNVVASSRQEISGCGVVCPKPRRLTFFNETILAKGLQGDCEIEQFWPQVASSPPIFCGSPPSRVANPLVQDARFGDENFSPISPSSWVVVPAPSGLPPSPSSSSRKGGCVRANFGNSPAVRIEGFDCLDRDRRNCSIPALA